VQRRLLWVGWVESINDAITLNRLEVSSVAEP
jgi:hypothetical protein